MHIYRFSHDKVHILKLRTLAFFINVISKIKNSRKNNYFLVFVILEHLPYCIFAYAGDFAYWVILHDFLSFADFFFKINISINLFRNTNRVSNSLNPDQARQIIRTD